MAKCPVCGQRKGKRACVQHGEPVCSVCCDETRGKACQGCSHHSGSKKSYNYTQVPFYDEQMMDDTDRQRMAAWVAWALCHLDRKEGMTDRQVSSLLERVMDVLYFREKNPAFADPRERKRFTWFTGELMKVVKSYPDDQWTRVVATVWGAVTREGNEGRGYLDGARKSAPIAPPIKNPSVLSRWFT
ncbi:hypothetical protein DSLASN_26510 [Desulfoluna limicola]|uniref:Uncharacterized protein n=1 Tax=Desulfoluna limicola TaxID=2810562 RepID=A0ABN6F4K7_9BACT|nr:hypothetical protein [Desulfoluna limicola]BCS97019.1 hypothetical protein DSLASN_26510 [Desulfoluna limicola]